MSENKSTSTVETHVELSYSVTAFIDLDELMKEVETTYTSLDVVGLHAKYDNLYLEMSDGKQLELDIGCNLIDMSPCYKYPSSIGVYETKDEIVNTLAEEDKYGYGVEFPARNQADETSIVQVDK